MLCCFGEIVNIAENARCLQAARVSGESRMKRLLPRTAPLYER